MDFYKSLTMVRRAEEEGSASVGKRNRSVTQVQAVGKEGRAVLAALSERSPSIVDVAVMEWQYSTTSK